MADFCKQCSVALFGEDFGDLKGICPDDPEFVAPVICEGCGGTLVNHDGECVYDCLKHHVPDGGAGNAQG